MADLRILAGASLSYCALDSQTGGIPTTPTWNALNAIRTIPDVGQAPNDIDCTTMDDTVYESSTSGLIPLGTLEFDFALEYPSATANINVVAGLDKDTSYGWKIEYANDITVTFISKPRYSFKGGSAGDLSEFVLYLTPIGGITPTVPTTHS